MSIKRYLISVAATLACLAILGSSPAAANDARYYDPSNPASPSGRTLGYELSRTIGCPGKSLMDEPCLMILKGVNFESDSSVLRPESSAVLDEVAEAIKGSFGVKIEVAGHTDSSASHEHNQKLSERRAQAVVDYLIMRGVAKNVLTAKGYGEDFPIADNATIEGRAINRRVELRSH